MIACDEDQPSAVSVSKTTSGAMIPDSETQIESKSDPVIAKKIPDVELTKPEEQIESQCASQHIDSFEHKKVPHSALLENSSSQLLCNEARHDQICGVLSAPKLEAAYILDVDMGDELTQKVIEGVYFVAHQLYDQLLLRVGGKVKQRRYPKSWMFKYRLKRALRIQISSDQHGIKRSMKL